VAEISVSSSTLGNPLQQMLMADAIEPGSDPSYQLCKTILTYHPLGAKLAEVPTAIAQSQPREITVTDGPEEHCEKAFTAEWEKLHADKVIFNLCRLSRVYGIASVAMLVEGEDTETEVDFEKFWNKPVSFNVFDPLNTSGSLVMNQDPNAADYQKMPGNITVQGQTYHRSRCFVKMNEDPIYIGYTNSAFGYVGRSVYQRTLYPLKSFIRTMIADEMVAKKCGLLVAMIKQAGSIVNAMMQAMAGVKRSILKIAETDNVISIGPDDKIAAIDLTNVNAAMETTRRNILNNIASGANMPAILVNEETFAEGFGEGTEDAKMVARYIDRYRKEELAPVYAWFDNIVQRRAWNEEFYAATQKLFPEYKNAPYETAFTKWQNSFSAAWPSLLVEPESERAKADDVKLKAVISLLEVLLPQADPDNKASVITWAADNINAMENLFSSPLMIDAEAMAEYVPPVPAAGDGDETKPPKPENVMQDSASVMELVRRAPSIGKLRDTA
jgi:hypothetical protein